VNDWSKLGNNTYYNLTLTLVVADSTGITVTLTDSFFLVIGSVNIAFSPMGYRTFYYNDPILIDYTTAFDPYQSETGKLTALWTCNSWLSACTNLKLT